MIYCFIMRDKVTLNRKFLYCVFESELLILLQYFSLHLYLKSEEEDEKITIAEEHVKINTHKLMRVK